MSDSPAQSSAPATRPAQVSAPTVFVKNSGKNVDVLKKEYEKLAEQVSNSNPSADPEYAKLRAAKKVAAEAYQQAELDARPSKRK